MSRASLCVAVLLILLLSWTVPSDATQANGTVGGTVLATDGAPIVNATIQLRGDRFIRTSRSDTHGAFVLRDVPSGVYAIEVRANGFSPLDSRVVLSRSGGINTIDLTLNRSAGSLITIGNVRVNGLQTSAATSAPAIELSAQSYAALGYSRVSDMLTGVLGVTMIRPSGGNPAAPAVASVRGPDPTETLIDVDGHETNIANSGAFDLSLLDPADFSTVQVVYGISPSSLIGGNTIGGAINVRTLEPTLRRYGLLRFSAGSYGTFGETLQATGTSDTIGYALSLHRITSNGAIDAEGLGSGIAAISTLAKLRFPLPRGGAASLTFRDQTAFKDESASLSAIDSDSTLNSFAGSAVLAHNAGYGLDLQLPLGALDERGLAHTTALFRHLTALTAQSVVGPAAGSSPYFFNDNDLAEDDTLEIDRLLPRGMLSAKLGARTESLDTQISLGATPDQSLVRRPMDDNADTLTAPLTPLEQKQHSFALRYTYDPSAQLHLAFATYYNWFDRYGDSFDPRVGMVWTPTASSAVRFSVGTTFQAPQLTELYVPPELPAPDASGHIDIGNPNLKPDRATEYDLGFDRGFALGRHHAHAAVDLYRTNLRAPSQRYLPAARCDDDSTPAEQVQCESYPINIGTAVYQGIESRFDYDLTPQIALHAAYGVNSAYPVSVPPQAQDGSLVSGQQFLGLPLHKATLSFERRPASGFGYDVGLVYESVNNELNRPAFAALNAAAIWRMRSIDVTLSGTNLTNVYDSGLTRVGAGVPYAGAFGPVSTDAYSLQGAAVMLSVTKRL